ncbi:MAG: valine--tRNA ligase [Syntrophales bacterium]|jgi:valyl-tRNA synthetase|nr:valine--tRNA ligase [Syntrophales bacterium]MCK9527595.1 valine--tRNA ligase [Syntrophales bacterium]MDX9922212.1 valine--tRNA ligase [Syntrophales bacterium]
MKKNRLSASYEPREVESRWYRYWIENRLFHAEDTSDREPFAIVIPPPNITGMLHMGHALNNTLQDLVIRFKRMQGYNALWMPGTDHAGIATQNVVEQELAREGTTRHEIGREAFVERVWAWREKYGSIILNQLQKLGCSCDWERERFTMDEGLSRAVREVFVRLYHDGLIYQGDYIVNWCPRCHTALSDLEVEYEQADSNLWHIRYPLSDGSGGIVVATTRPETMLGDTAVAVNPDDERYRSMVGKTAILPLMNREIPIIEDSYVSREFGTGAVKITPAADPNDFAMARRHDLQIVSIMDESAVINENGGPYHGQDCLTARANVVADLKARGYLLKVEPYSHNVGCCYRCKTNVEPMVSKQWFMKVDALAKTSIAAVVKGNTRIVPVQWEATYFDWLENIRDWCISRQIWWGHRIPVWYCDACGELTAAVDEPPACSRCGADTLRQDEDVLDTWFSSALWPFSTLGWPDETPALKTFYPTSLLVTGFDIIFFWVARMMMMGIYVMKEVPFRNVYLHALVRDEQGEKMSKSKGNIIDPLHMIDRFGADAFRFTLAAFTAQGRDVKMSESRVEGYRNFINKIWNAYRFCMMNLEDYDEKEECAGEDYSLCDRWIRDRLNRTVREATAALDEYRFNDAATELYQFFWHEFCDWYLELVKGVLYSGEGSASRAAAQQTLLRVLRTSIKLLHPFIPFITEEIWQSISDTGTSVMISRYPVADDGLDDPDAAADMDLIRNVIMAIRNIRGVMRVPPGKKIRALALCPDGDSMEILRGGDRYVTDLAGLTEFAAVNDAGDVTGAAVAVVGPLKIYVYLGDAIDVETEKARLEKEVGKIDADLERVSMKLENQDFRTKASEEIVVKEQEKYDALKARSAVLRDALLQIGDIAAS